MFIALNNFSIPGYKSGEPQNDILGDDLVFDVLTIFMTFDDFRTTFVGTVECFQLCLFCI
jgi:hypothetical protein